MDDEANPVLVEVTRGDRVESIHRGRVVVVGRNGSIELALGEISAPVYWRSAAKPFQTAALISAGVAERYALESEDLALISASHNGEDVHAERAAKLLARAGLDESALQCGPHPSIAPRVAYQLAARGTKLTRLRSNCSGKHAGMLLFAQSLGADLSRYTDVDHPVQVAIRDAVAAISGLGAVSSDAVAVDGCSAPTFALPLTILATAFRNLALAGQGLAPPVATYESALVRVREAMTLHAYLVAGLGRFDTDLMTETHGAVVSKIGAEGVVACGLPAAGIGIAIKCDDGSTRGYEPLLLELLRRYGVVGDSDSDALASYTGRTLRNFAGIRTGTTRVLLP